MSDQERPAGVFVEFYTDAVHLTKKSEEEGRPVFADMPHIRKLVPGDATNIIERVAKDFDKQAYPKQWAAFEANATAAPIGMPLEQWPQITRGQVKELKHFNVHSVEQLSELSDSNCSRLGMGVRELRAKALTWLNASRANAAAVKQDAENAQLRTLVAEMQAQINAMAEAPNARRGRPPNAAKAPAEVADLTPA